MRKSCLNSVYELACKDPRIVFIGSDLGPGVMAEFKSRYPERFFMEGVMEQNVIGMAAGLAMEGFIPYVNTIATFLTRRCLEQVAIDLCLHNLRVRLIGNGGGLVYAPLGPTHLATEDIALMRALPNMAVVAPADAPEMVRFMAQSADWPGPLYIRLGKGGEPVVSRETTPFAIGKGITLREGTDVVILATGVMVHRALTVAQGLAASDIKAGVINLHTLKPLDETLILETARRSGFLVSLEEHTRIGGLGSAIAELLMDQPIYPQPRLLRLALPDVFTTQYGSQESLLQSLGLQPEAIEKAVRRFLDIPTPPS